MSVCPAIALATRKSKRWLQTINFRERYTECVSFFLMDFSLLTTSGVSQKRNEAVGNTKPPAMRVEDKLFYKKITFPL